MRAIAWTGGVAAVIAGVALIASCAPAPKVARFDVWDWHPHGIPCCMRRMHPLPQSGERA